MGNDSAGGVGIRWRRAVACGVAMTWPATAPSFSAEVAAGFAAPPVVRLQAHIVAVGLPNVAGVQQVGRFHHGGPIPGNPEFLLQTATGRVLDPERLLVAVGSNYGAPLGAVADAPGSILSIDPTQPATLVVPPRFAHAGGQASSDHGAVQVYSAQSPAFLNARHNAGSRTAGAAATSGPRYISVNNAFGRPWIANAPRGVAGEGSLSVDDTDGAPLANAPSDDAGGVFAGQRSNRRQATKGHASSLFGKFFNDRDSPQLSAGNLASGVLGTAFLGASPDGTGLAVFAAATADGAVAQVHVRYGVDGLAPPGTVQRSDDDGGVIGMALRWNPRPVLYVVDPGRSRLVLLHLANDGHVFKLARTGVVASPWFDQPVDIAAAVPEIASPAFASHTTLAGGSDLYVANRGDGSIVRLSPRGEVLARAIVELPGGQPLAGGRLRALAVSADATRLWLTVQGDAPGHPGREGFLMEVTGFDADGPFEAASAAGTARSAGSTAAIAAASAASAPSVVAVGAEAFARTFSPEDGLGPLFNERSCIACHPGPGGSSALDEHFALRVAHIDGVTGRVTPIEHPNSPLLRRHSIRELGHPDAIAATTPRSANLRSLRMPPTLYAGGAIDRIADASIEAEAVSKGDGIKGRVHHVKGSDGQTRIGRYGWKADVASLDDMVAEAFASELGIGHGLSARPRADGRDDVHLMRSVAAYLRQLTPPDASKGSR